MSTFIASLTAVFQLVFGILSGNAAAQPPVLTEYPITYTIVADDFDTNQTVFQIPATGEGIVTDYNYTVVSNENGRWIITPIDSYHRWLFP